MATYPIRKDRSTVSSVSTGYTSTNTAIERSFSGWGDTDWKKKRAQKLDATTPFYGVDESLIAHPPQGLWLLSPRTSEGRTTVPVYPYHVGGTSQQVFNDSALDAYEAGAKSLCLTNLNRWISENRTPVNAQVMGLEMLETLKFLSNPFSAMRKLADTQKYANYRRHVANLKKVKQRVTDRVNARRFYRTNTNGSTSRDIFGINSGYSPYHGLSPRQIPGLKREDVNDLNEALNDLADAWLEIRFGLLPMMSDVSDIINGVSKNMDKTLRSHFSAYPQPQSRSTQKAYVGVYNTMVGKDSEISYELYRTITFEFNFYISYGLNYNLLRPGSREDAIAGNLASAADWLPSVWEAIPYSWLVDYFSNIGDQLNAFSNNMNVKPAFNCWTWVRKEIVRYEVVPRDIQTSGFNPQKPWVYKGSNPIIDRVRKRVTRSVGSQQLLDVQFKFPYKPAQLLNMLSVAKKHLLNF